MKYIEYYKRNLETWGEETQILKCIEELGELTQSLARHLLLGKVDQTKNKGRFKQEIEWTRNEIADALNMVEQMAFIFGADEIDKIRAEKLKHTEEFRKSFEWKKVSIDI